MASDGIFSLALNGGGRFLSPSSPLSSLLCSLVSWDTLSALLSKLKYSKRTESSLQKLECLLAPKTKQSYLFSGSPTVALARLLLESTPGVQCSETLLRSSPTLLQTLQTLPPPPDHSPLFASIRWPGQAGLTSAGSVAAGSDGCLLGRIHFPCGYVVYVLLCCWGVFPVLTLYSPRSIVWGLFFSLNFPHVNAVFFFNSTCISLLIILVWLCMWRIINKEHEHESCIWWSVCV